MKNLIEGLNKRIEQIWCLCSELVASKYLRLNGHMLVTVKLINKLTSLYGYITKLDYENYINDSLNGVLVIKHPYNEHEEIIIKIDRINSIKLEKEY